MAAKGKERINPHYRTAHRTVMAAVNRELDSLRVYRQLAGSVSRRMEFESAVHQMKQLKVIVTGGCQMVKRITGGHGGHGRRRGRK
jgi:hypothetical protein